MPTITDVFPLLERWRHFPDYQLERRADIFFALYLRPLLEERVKQKLQDIIIPELPIKRDLVLKRSETPKARTHQSVKVDYVLFPADKKDVYFVELKTDMNSRRDLQDSYLKKCEDIRFDTILEGIIEIAKRTEHLRKYVHLLTSLSEAGYLTLPPELAQVLYPKQLPSARAYLGEIKIVPIESKPKVYYIQPEHSGDENSISFTEVARFLSRYEDDFSKSFADYLAQWNERAGSVEPR